ncbi:MAG: zinc-binding dehydrogenase, partial [Burkholderiaceae bacterium]
VNGTIASFGTASNPAPTLDWAAFMHRNIRLCGVGIFSVPESRKLEAAAFVQSCLAAGQLWHRIDSRWPLDEIAKAHQHQETGHPRGKVIVSIS